MTPSQRERLRIVIESALLVRRGESITPELANERSRNMTTIVELFIDELGEVDKWKDVPGSDQETRGSESRGRRESGAGPVPAGRPTSTGTTTGSSRTAGFAAKNTGETAEEMAERLIT